MSESMNDMNYLYLAEIGDKNPSRLEGAWWEVATWVSWLWETETRQLLGAVYLQDNGEVESANVCDDKLPGEAFIINESFTEKGEGIEEARKWVEDNCYLYTRNLPPSLNFSLTE